MRSGYFRAEISKKKRHGIYVVFLLILIVIWTKLNETVDNISLDFFLFFFDNLLGFDSI